MADTLEQADVKENYRERSRFTSPMGDGPRRPTSKSSRSMWPSGDGRHSPSRCIRTPQQALGLSEGSVDPSLTRNVPFLVTSPDYDRDTITLYF